MTSQEYPTFQTAFQKASGLHPSESEFLDAWFPSLQGTTLSDALAGVARLPADPRVVKTPPRDRLPILLDLIADIKAERDRATQKPIKWPDRPGPGEAWDRRMLQLGAIDQAEFDRRMEARK